MSDGVEGWAGVLSGSRFCVRVGSGGDDLPLLVRLRGVRLLLDGGPVGGAAVVDGEGEPAVAVDEEVVSVAAGCDGPVLLGAPASPQMPAVPPFAREGGGGQRRLDRPAAEPDTADVGVAAGGCVDLDPYEAYVPVGSLDQLGLAVAGPGAGGDLGEGRLPGAELSKLPWTRKPPADDVCVIRGGGSQGERALYDPPGPAVRRGGSGRAPEGERGSRGGAGGAVQVEAGGLGEGAAGGALEPEGRLAAGRQLAVVGHVARCDRS